MVVLLVCMGGGGTRLRAETAETTSMGGEGQTTQDGQEKKEEEKGEQGGGDFYSILGVSPQATKQEIKAAYRSLMKDVHPDQWDYDGGDDESNEFAIFINYIYEILMDDEARVEYNVLAGFSLTEQNPFSGAGMKGVARLCFRGRIRMHWMS